MKTSMMVIQPKALHVSWLLLFFHRPVHLVLLILKQHLLPVYCFTIKQAGLIVIKRKAFSNHTLFCSFVALPVHFFVYFSIRIHFALNATNSVMAFPPSSSFSMLITFLFFPMGSGLFSCLEYPLVSNLVSISSAMSL